MKTEDEEGEIVIKLEENMATIMPSDPNEYITVKTREEKEYLQFLKEKGVYSKTGLRSKLKGMRLYEDFREKQGDTE